MLQDNLGLAVLDQADLDFAESVSVGDGAILTEELGLDGVRSASVEVIGR